MANTKVTGDLIASLTIATGNIADNAVTSDKISGITTAHITEGSNLYYTDARARGAVSVSGNALSYNSSTGVITSNFEESPVFTGDVTIGDNKSIISNGSVRIDIDNDNNSTTRAFLVRNNGGTNTLFRVQEDGNVGIGTSDIDFELQVGGTDLSVTANFDAQFAVLSEATTGYPSGFIFKAPRVATSSNRVLLNEDFGTYFSSQVYATSTGGAQSDIPIVFAPLGGKVGIGDANPSFILDTNITNSRARFKANTGDANIELSSIAGRDWLISSLTDGSLRFYDEDAASERMRINSSGRVGIGISNPNSYDSNADNLVIGSTGANDKNGITIVGGDTDGRGAIYFADTAQNSAGYITYLHSNNSMLLGTSDSTRMIIDNSGNVGIGTTSPDSKVDIESNHSQLRLTDSDDNKFVLFSYSGGKLIARNNSINTTTNQFTLTQDGNFGIGTISPGAYLQIGDYPSNNIDITTYPDVPSEHMIHLSAPETNTRYGAGISFGEDSFTAANITVQDAGGNGALNMLFGTRHTSGTVQERMRILSSGGITFNGDTATANALDDYEEGTWTPTNLGSSGLSTDPTSFSGRYTKIGRQVIVSFVLAGYSCGTGIKNIVIGGFPFIQHSAAHTETGYCSTYPHSDRRSGIVIDNSGGDSNNWFVSFKIDTAASNRTIRGTVIYTTT